MSKNVMVCKMQLHHVNPGATQRISNELTLNGAQVSFGGVWEGSTENQQKSENAVFGYWTPMAEFKATIFNEQVVEQLKPGKKYYVTFTEAPD